MDPFTVLVTLFILSAVFLYLVGGKKRHKNYPPGPRGVPIFGNAFQLGPQGHKPALEMSKIYGDILGLQVGMYNIVFINNADDIREILNKSEFSARSGYNAFLDKNTGDVNAGLIMSYGTPWLEHRRFTLRTLRDFGFGKRSLEHIIQEEVDGLMEQFGKVEGQAISTQTLFNISAFNVIWSIVAGERFPLNHPRLMELINLLNDFFSTTFDGLLFLSFIFPPVVRLRNKFSFLRPKQRSLFRQKLFEFFRVTIKEHRATREEGALPRDFIDAYMEEVKKNETNEASSFKPDDEDDDFKLIVTLMDLFVAGGETTSTTMTWAFFLLALHPQVQEKAYKEIIKAGASDRSVTLSDRPSLVYIEAVMAEIFRISTLTPSAIPHSAVEDATFKGYFIPKGTLIVPNIYGAHFDEKTWGDPKVFRPERFLTEEDGGLKFHKHSSLMPFSVGKRECLGMSLAKDEFFLFLTNSIRNFWIAMPADEPSHTFEGKLGLVNLPEPHKIILTRRQ